MKHQELKQKINTKTCGFLFELNNMRHKRGPELLGIMFMFLLMRQSEWQAMHVNMNYVCAAHTHQSYQSIFLSSRAHTHAS